MKSTQPDSRKSLKLVIRNNLNNILINVRNQTEKMNTEKNIYISPGTETNLAINRVFIERLEPPYSNCKSEVSFELNETRSFLYKQKEW